MARYEGYNQRDGEAAEERREGEAREASGERERENKRGEKGARRRGYPRDHYRGWIDTHHGFKVGAHFIWASHGLGCTDFLFLSRPINMVVIVSNISYF